MAIVTRRYVLVGPTDEMLDNFVSASALEVAVEATYPTTTKDINVDNAIPGLIATLDEYMTMLGFAFSATASPKQVFSYVATGAETNPFTIGAGQGLIPRIQPTYSVNVSIMRGAANTIKVPAIVGGTMTALQFDVELSDDIEAGDILMFTVEDLT